MVNLPVVTDLPPKVSVNSSPKVYEISINVFSISYVSPEMLVLSLKTDWPIPNLSQIIVPVELVTSWKSEVYVPDKPLNLIFEDSEALLAFWLLKDFSSLWSN